MFGHMVAQRKKVLSPRSTSSKPPAKANNNNKKSQ